MKLCIFHKWKEFVNEYAMKERVCVKCGKRQIQLIQEIGQDEYSYSRLVWVDKNKWKPPVWCERNG